MELQKTGRAQKAGGQDQASEFLLLVLSTAMKAPWSTLIYMSNTAS